MSSRITSAWRRFSGVPIICIDFARPHFAFWSLGRSPSTLVHIWAEDGTLLATASQSTIVRAGGERRV